MAFKKGQSGNPAGRPPGVKSSIAALRKELISDEDLQAIVDVVINKAKEGDLTAAGMILDRRLPRLRLSATIEPAQNLAQALSSARERLAQFEADKLLQGAGGMSTLERLVLLSFDPEAKREHERPNVPVSV